MRRKSGNICKCFLIVVVTSQLVASTVFGQTTDIVILEEKEVVQLREVVLESKEAKILYDSVRALAVACLDDSPNPLAEINYEGLLDTDPARIETMRGLADIDKVANLVYAYYGDPDLSFAGKAREFVLAWAHTYKATGNTINENKLVPLFWAYFIFQDEFSSSEKGKVTDWMLTIADSQVTLTHIRNNNWEAKRQKIIAIVGCILESDRLKQSALADLKTYIRTAYYDDGTSNDLRHRDALLYHIGGLTPVVALFVSCARFDPAFELFNYQAPSGASIRKSVEYTVPYARGEILRKEWINSKVHLDKERAQAGIEKYRPGKLFDPADAIRLFEWAAYYENEWFSILSRGSDKDPFTATWVGLLNSPLVRK